jgi:hypothetical protein
MDNLPNPESDSRHSRGSRVTDYSIALGSTWEPSSELETWSLRYERKSQAAAAVVPTPGALARRGTLEVEAAGGAVALHWHGARADDFSGHASGANPSDCVLIYDAERKTFVLERLSRLVTSLRPTLAAAPKSVKPATSKGPAAAAARKRKAISEPCGSVQNPLAGREPSNAKRQRARGKVAGMVEALHTSLKKAVPLVPTRAKTKFPVAATGGEKGKDFKKQRGRAPIGKVVVAAAAKAVTFAAAPKTAVPTAKAAAEAEIVALEALKAAAVEVEDYSEASRLKEKIEILKATAGSELLALEALKAAAVAAEDYGEATRLKGAIERLRAGDAAASAASLPARATRGGI